MTFKAYLEYEQENSGSQENFKEWLLDLNPMTLIRYAEEWGESQYLEGAQKGLVSMNFRKKGEPLDLDKITKQQTVTSSTEQDDSVTTKCTCSKSSCTIGCEKKHTHKQYFCDECTVDSKPFLDGQTPSEFITANAKKKSPGYQHNKILSSTETIWDIHDFLDLLVEELKRKGSL